MRHGFTLLELSIVLVIVGLLAGGVMTGQALIRAAELRAGTTELTRYTTALNAFRDKYRALPGDMRNATSFWGAAHATPATCITTQGSGTQTCNGDGDGRIGGDLLMTAVNYEDFRAWQHLANAGMIEGSYTGLQMYGANMFSEPGINVPKSKVTNGAYFMYYYDRSSVGMFPTTVGNILWFGAYHGGWYPDNPLLSPEEAWSIDTKLDDGKPGMGMITTPTAATLLNCSIGDYTAPGSAVYALSNSGPLCHLAYRL